MFSKKIYIAYDTDIFMPTDTQKLHSIYFFKFYFTCQKLFNLPKAVIQVMATNTIKFYYIYLWDVY